MTNAVGSGEWKSTANRDTRIEEQFIAEGAMETYLAPQTPPACRKQVRNNGSWSRKRTTRKGRVWGTRKASPVPVWVRFASEQKAS